MNDVSSRWYAIQKDDHIAFIWQYAAGIKTAVFVGPVETALDYLRVVVACDLGLEGAEDQRQKMVKSWQSEDDDSGPIDMDDPDTMRREIIKAMKESQMRTDAPLIPCAVFGLNFD